jgi:hypothetical protein
MEIISTILKYSSVLVGLLVMGYLWGLFQDWLSKSFNTNISYRGKIVSRPHYHEENIKVFKEFKNKVFEYVQRVKIQKKDLDISEKIKLLKQLEELKINGSLTDQQYTELKETILK